MASGVRFRVCSSTVVSSYLSPQSMRRLSGSPPAMTLSSEPSPDGVRKAATRLAFASGVAELSMAGPTAGLQPLPHRLQRRADRLIQRLARIDVNHWAAREIGLAFAVPASAHPVRIGPAPLAPPGIPLEAETPRRHELPATRRPRQHPGTGPL